MATFSERNHNTDAQVRGYIEAALALVEELDPPGDLREHVFIKATDLYSAKQIIMEQMQPAFPGMAIPRGRG